MNKIVSSQLELFSSTGEPKQARHEPSVSLLKHLVNYERAIFVIIGFILVGTVGFCLGVDKGKKMARAVTTFTLPYAKLKINPKPAQPEKTTQIPISSPVEPREVLEGYTIQVASFQTAKNAKKEAEALKKKGLTPVILTKGGYTVVCVGSFVNREAAGILLTQLKKQYHDCRIRRL